MLNVLDSTKELYMTSSHKAVVISVPGKSLTFNNANLVSESVTLKESIESNDELQFKGCNSSCLKFKVAGLVMDIRGQYIEATIQAGTGEVIPLFHGYVVNQSNRTYEDVVSEITCYDVLYKIRDLDVTAWYTSLQSTRTVKQIRDSLFDYLNTQYGYSITQETVTLENDSLNVKRMNTDKLPKVITAGYMLESICQANARFGQIGRDSKFYYRKLKFITKGLYPSTETFPSDETFPSGENSDIGYDLSLYSRINYEPYFVEKINCVVIRDNEGKATSYGSGTNVFTLADNIIAQTFSNKSAAAQNIYNAVKDLWYIPMTLDCAGFPWVECGDAIYTNTRRNVVRSFVLQRTLKGIQALFDTLEADGNQYRTKYSESEETGISSNRNNVYEVADDLHTHYLTADTINTYFLKTEDLEAQTIYARQISGGTADLGYINGNVIEANSITSAQIHAGAITASKISADAFSGDQFTGSTFKIGSAYTSSLYVGGGTGGRQWQATWKQFDQISSGDFVLWHSSNPNS